MSLLDSILFGLYLVAVLAVGWRFRGERRSAEHYFLADRNMAWFPVGISVMVTAFSAVNVLALTVEVMKNGMYVAAAFPVFLLVALPITRVLIPFLHRMQLTSAYEYLERRFDVRVRCGASLLFMGWRVLWMGAALFACSKLLSVIAGLDVRLVILIAGGVAATYTSLGGMRAVMWTDVAQFAVLFGSVAVCLAVGIGHLGPDWWETIRQAGAARPLSPFDAEFLSLDPTVRISLWSALLGTSVAFLARYGADQVVVQRYFAAKSSREACRGFWLNSVAAVATLLLLVALAWVTLAATGAAAAPMPPLKRLVTLLALTPPGITGLLAAGVAAATMSSVDSGINSCSAALWSDFRTRFGSAGNGTTEQRPKRTRDTLLFAALAVLLAFWILHSKHAFFGLMNRVVNGLGSPLLAVFLLGMFTRANARGVAVGLFIGTVFSIAFSLGVDGVALHYYAVVNLTVSLLACGLASWGFSLTGARNTAEQLQWRWHRDCRQARRLQ